jgi:hypothetical protein
MGIAMLELKYLALLLCLSVVGALAGLAAHFWRSEVGNGTGADEDPVYERGALVVLPTRENRWFEKNVVKADWDSYGWWEFASLRNFLWYVGGGALMPWLGGLMLWPYRAELLVEVCRPLAQIGLVPMFCP